MIKMDSTSKQPPSTLKIECPFAIKWEIDEAKLVAMKDSNDGCLKTKKIKAANLPGVKYSLEICPNGQDEESRGDVIIFLELESVMKVNSNFKFIIESADHTVTLGTVNEETEFLGGEICTTEELFDPANKYIVDGKLSLKCQGTLSIEQEIESADKRWEDNDVGKVLWNRGDKDFTIIVDGNSLQAHKNVLSARSPVFEAMFNAKMKETTENKMDITDFIYETVNAAIQLCYNRKISTLVLGQKIGVLQFFDKYEILDLKDVIEASLIEDISTSNVCRLANSSIISNAIKLQQKCMDFLVDCVKKSQMVSEFNTLDQGLCFKMVENAFYNVQIA